MLNLSQYLLVASTIMLGLALVAYVVGVTLRRPARTQTKEHAYAGRPPAEVPPGSAGETGEHPHPPHGVIWYGSRLCQLGLVLLTGSLIARALATGHGPFANQHEFAVSFAWGIVAAWVYFEFRYAVRSLALAVLPVALAMLVYAQAIDTDAQPLVPALQNNFLLTLHVATAVLSYGAAAVAFGAAVLYLVRPRISWRGLPSAAVLDEIGYRAAVLAYPLMTVMILLGAIWADIAWGSYWSWDPKETAALVTWLIYGAYLHARVVRDWRGERAAWLLILGFAAVLFTYFGNLFFGGLHGYA